MAERIIIILQCTVCKSRNYYFARGKKKDYKLELKKFCSKCRKHTVHKEIK
ncbi:MAG: 50S ribosomal protein L33 [Elusimicrobiota bacterium]|nr:50S ribosomal protein L33 [Elusimicrobiota bacterium]